MEKRLSIQRIGVVLLFALILFLTPQSGIAKEAPQYGGTVVFLITGMSVNNIGNPYYSVGSNTPLLRPCGEGLVDIDDNGNYLPRLATSWKIDTKAKTVTFSLRKGVKFHDGTPFNAQAAKYCLDLTIKGENGASWSSVGSIDVVDDYAIRFNFNKGFDWGAFNALAANPSSMQYSPTALQTHDKSWTLLHPVGTGPFKFDSYTPDASIKYVRFDDYWGGKPYLDGVEIRLMGDATTALLSLKNKEGHILSVEPKDVKSLKNSGYNAQAMPHFTRMYMFDSSDPTSPFANEMVRKAFSYAIDRKKIADAVGYGYFEATNQPFGPSSWAHSTNVVGQPYNPDQARELLAQAGYPNGLDTTLTYSAHYNGDQDLNTTVQDQLAKVGIRAKINYVTLSGYTQARKGGWKGVLCGSLPNWGFSEPARSLRLGVADHQLGYKSQARFTDVETLVDELGQLTEKADKKAKLDQINSLVIDKHCAIVPVYKMAQVIITAPEVHGLDVNKSAYWTYNKTWLSK